MLLRLRQHRPKFCLGICDRLSYDYSLLTWKQRVYQPPAIIAALGTAFHGISCVFLHDGDEVWVQHEPHEPVSTKGKEISISTKEPVQTQETGVPTENLMQTQDASSQTRNTKLRKASLFEGSKRIYAQIALKYERKLNLRLLSQRTKLNEEKEQLKEEKEQLNEENAQLIQEKAQLILCLILQRQDLQAKTQRLEMLHSDDRLIRKRCYMKRLRHFELLSHVSPPASLH